MSAEDTASFLQDGSERLTGTREVLVVQCRDRPEHEDVTGRADRPLDLDDEAVTERTLPESIERPHGECAHHRVPVDRKRHVRARRHVVEQIDGRGMCVDRGVRAQKRDHSSESPCDRGFGARFDDAGGNLQRLVDVTDEHPLEGNPVAPHSRDLVERVVRCAELGPALIEARTRTEHLAHATAEELSGVQDGCRLQLRRCSPRGDRAVTRQPRESTCPVEVSDIELRHGGLHEHIGVQLRLPGHLFERELQPVESVGEAPRRTAIWSSSPFRH